MSLVNFNRFKHDKLHKLFYNLRLYKILKPIYGGIGTIFTLHRILPIENKKIKLEKHLSISPQQLEYCIKWLRKKDYAFVSIDDVYDILKGNKPNQRFVCFTFDDGYIDNLTYAYPIFKKYNIPFTLYITTGFPDRTAIMWWYLLEELLLSHDKINFKIKGKEFSYQCVGHSEKVHVFAEIRHLIMNSNKDEYFNSLKQIFEPYHLDLYTKTKQKALSWDQIAELSCDSNVTIGAHTVNHLILNKLTPLEVKQEVLESKNKIETIINKKVEHFSYPFGSKNQIGQREFALIKELDFKTAVTTNESNVFKEYFNYLEQLPRVGIFEFMLNDQDLNRMVCGVNYALKNPFKVRKAC